MHKFFQTHSYTGNYYDSIRGNYLTVLADWKCKICGTQVLAIPDGVFPISPKECKGRPHKGR